MHKKKSRGVNPFLIIGTVLLIAALSLYIYNYLESQHAGAEADSVLTDVQSQISALIAQNGDVDDSEDDTEDTDSALATPVPDMQTLTIDGNEYIGYISIPTQKIELPVMSDWDYDKLNIAPCRQYGSYYTDDLVIAAHNFDTHFGKLKNMSKGDRVDFTDATGKVHHYEVVRIETIQPDNVDAVQNSGNDLVLYTCTKGGATRVTVFCDRIETKSNTAKK
jgi:sortase A